MPIEKYNSQTVTKPFQIFTNKDWKEPSQSFLFRFLYRFLKTRGWNSSSTRFSFIENPANQTPKHTQMTLKTLIQIYPVRKCLLQPNSQNTSKQNYPPHIVKRGEAYLSQIFTNFNSNLSETGILMPNALQSCRNSLEWVGECARKRWRDGYWLFIFRVYEIFKNFSII